MQPDDLYGLPLDEFIAQRTALARALRAEQQRDAANAVAARRKPSVAAWAVNQLVRSQGSAVGALYDAGDALREAQERLLAGSGDGRALRAANERERAAVGELVEAARGLLDSDGHELSASVLERVSDTLHAAALDPDAREQVRPGCLERELRHAGLGLGESAFASAAPARQARPAKQAKPADETTAQRAERERAAREQAEERRRAAAEREAARRAARSEEAAARRRVERSAAALRAAQERRERAAGALAAADEALEAAHAEAREAAAEHERARAALEHL